MSLPLQDIPAFEGDPLQYRTSIKASEQGLEERQTLFYLEQFTRGQPQELVHSCQRMVPEQGHVVAKRARNILETSTKLQVHKALAWQAIKSEDMKAFQAYSLFLHSCCNLMKELKYMQELNMPVNMRAIISKVPYKMREQWRTKAQNIMESTDHRATFSY